MEKLIFDVNGMKLIFGREGEHLLFSGIDTQDAPLLPAACLTAPFMAGVQGQFYGGSPKDTLSYSQLSKSCRLLSLKDSAEALELQYACTGAPLEVTVRFEKCKTASAVRVFTCAKNTGTEPLVLTHLSSGFLQGIVPDAFLWNFPKERLQFYTCYNAWCGEGQWRKADPFELGIYYTGTHTHAANAHFEKVGSQSTSRYLPLLLAEDTAKNRTYFLQLETSSSWHIEAGYRNAPEEEAGSFYLLADAARERNSVFYKELQPGESYAAEPAAIGCCPGGFDQGVAQLTAYRREKIKPANAWEGECPVCFNDYMNTLWGNPTLETLLPLIDAAAKAGAEAFCIDAGWFDKKGELWGSSLGDWTESPDRFGDKNLQYVLDYIKAKGLIPGLWLEMEVANAQSAPSREDDRWFLCRNGKRVADTGRYFLDFSHPPVRAYMHGVIDRLMAMGIGFIKNDYNSCISVGDDKYGSPALHMQEHLRGFYAFIDEVRAKYPRLIIENCGSGALREDNQALSHFHLQSVSDQEIYHLMPSIVTGSLAGVLPEQLGIWSFPYSLRYAQRTEPELLAQPEYIAKMADGEETVFNMVSGMAGNLYLSGYLSYADEKNLQLVQESMALYKGMRSFIRQSFPLLPCGFNGIEQDDSFAVLLLENAEKTQGYLYIWRRGSRSDTVSVPLSGYKQAEKIYPQKAEYDCALTWKDDTLQVTLQKPYTARLINVSK